MNVHQPKQSKKYNQETKSKGQVSRCISCIILGQGNASEHRGKQILFAIGLLFLICINSGKLLICLGLQFSS